MEFLKIALDLLPINKIKEKGAGTQLVLRNVNSEIIQQLYEFVVDCMDLMNRQIDEL